MRTTSKIIFIIVLIHLNFSSYAQSKGDTLSLHPFTTELEINTAYSQMGITTGIGVSVKRSANQFSLGFRTSPIYYKSYSEMPLGLYAEYKRYMGVNKKLNPFVNAYYGNTLMNLGTSFNTESKNEKYMLNELYIGYGVNLKLGKFNIANSILFGVYLESQTHSYNSNKSYYLNKSYQIKMSISYGF